MMPKYRAVSTGSEHPRIPDFRENGPIGLGEAVVLGGGGVVRVADKEHGAGIELVGEEKLGEEPFVLGASSIVVEIRVELVVDVLEDRPDEAPRVELPRGL